MSFQYEVLLAEVLRRLDAGDVPDEIEGRLVEVKADPSLQYRSGIPTGPGDAQDEPTARKIADAAACLANSGGGLVLLGVDDRTGRLDGTPCDAEWMHERLVALTEPSLAATVLATHHRTVRLIAVTVPGAGDEPHRAPDSRRSSGTRYTIRAGRQCVELGFGEWARRLEVRRRERADWSAAPTGTAPESVGDAAVARVRELTATSRDAVVRQASGEDVTTLLRTAGLLASDGTLNRAGHLLLIDASPAGIDYHFVERADGLPLDRRTGDNRALLLVLADLDVQMAAHNLDHPEVQGFVVAERRAIAPESLREAIINAVAHRDYARTGVGIQIKQRPDRLEVESCGPLLHDVEGRVLSASQPRNHQLADALRRLGLADRVGRGIDAMYRQALLRGHPRPVIATAGTSTRCVLIGGPPDPTVAVPLAHVDPSERLTADVLVAVDELRHRPWIDQLLLTDLLGLPVPEVAERIDQWQARLRFNGDRLFQSMTPDGAVLSLTPSFRTALERGIEWLPARREKLAQHIVTFTERVGRVSRGDVMSMTGVSAPSASNWLSDLADIGEIEIGTARGRDAHYVPAG